jgi:hypothetical protein
MTATAYERILEKPRTGQKVRQGTSYSVAQCPSYEHRQTSLTVHSKPGKAKVVCFAGCSDVLDVLPALGMTVADLYDDRRSGPRTAHQPDPEIQARIETRRSMTPSRRHSMTCYSFLTSVSGYASASHAYVQSCTSGSASSWAVSPMADVFA